MKACFSATHTYTASIYKGFIFLYISVFLCNVSFDAHASASSSTASVGVDIITSIPPTPLPPPPTPTPPPTPEPPPIPPVTPVSPIPSQPLFSLAVFDTYKVRVSGVSSVSGTVYITTEGTSASGIPIALNVLSVTVSANGMWRYETNALNAGRYEFAVYVVSDTGTSESTTPQFIDMSLHTPSSIDTSVIGGRQLYVSGKSFPSGNTRIKITRHGFSNTSTDSNNSNGNFSFTSDELLPGSYSAYFATVDQLDLQGDWSDAYTFIIPEVEIPVQNEVIQGKLATPTQEGFVSDIPVSNKSQDAVKTDISSTTGHQEDAHLGVSTIGMWIRSVSDLLTLKQWFVLAAVISAAIVIVLSSVAKRSIMFILGGLFAKIYKRKKYGTVYDSLTGKPVYLAKVCLRDSDNHLVDVQITDMSGMYGFTISPGEYRIIAEKEGYIPQSSVSVSSELQRKYINTYTSGDILVTPEYFISRDIPLTRVR